MTTKPTTRILVVVSRMLLHSLETGLSWFVFCPELWKAFSNNSSIFLPFLLIEVTDHRGVEFVRLSSVINSSNLSGERGSIFLGNEVFGHVYIMISDESSRSNSYFESLAFLVDPSSGILFCKPGACCALIFSSCRWPSGLSPHFCGYQFLEQYFEISSNFSLKYIQGFFCD